MKNFALFQTPKVSKKKYGQQTFKLCFYIVKIGTLNDENVKSKCNKSNSVTKKCIKFCVYNHFLHK